MIRLGWLTTIVPSISNGPHAAIGPAWGAYSRKKRQRSESGLTLRAELPALAQWWIRDDSLLVQHPVPPTTGFTPARHPVIHFHALRDGTWQYGTCSLDEWYNVIRRKSRIA